MAIPSLYDAQKAHTGSFAGAAGYVRSKHVIVFPVEMAILVRN
jgi:hypothetical protein